MKENPNVVIVPTDKTNSFVDVQLDDAYVEMMKN